MSTEPCRRWVAAAVAGALSLLLAACSALPDPLEVAAGDLVSSAATARLAADENAAGRLTSTATTVTVTDATREVASAARSLAELSLTGRRDALRDELFAEAVVLVGDLHDLADVVESGDTGDLAEVARRLEELDRRLTRLESRVRSS